jgi:uncharacterized protein
MLKNSLKISIWLIASLYLLFILALYWMQTDFLYHPTKAESHDYSTLKIKNEVGSLNVFVLNPGQKHAILYFGGNAENMLDVADFFSSKLFESSKLNNHTLYLMEYRGYGDSDGKPSEQAIMSDAFELYETIQDQFQSISLIGRSLGSGVAVQVAAAKPINKLVLVTPYDSIKNVAQLRFPFAPVSFLLRDKYLSEEYVQAITAPTLVLVAESDRVIPRGHTDNLIQTFKNAPQSIVIKQTTHNNIVNNPLYIELISSFID